MNSNTIPEQTFELDHKIKVKIVGECKEAAELELVKYYIRDVIPDFYDTLTYIKEESENVYIGSDHCYNKGNCMEFVFEFMMDKSISWEEVYRKLFVDAVKEVHCV